MDLFSRQPQARAAPAPPIRGTSQTAATAGGAAEAPTLSRESARERFNGMRGIRTSRVSLRPRATPRNVWEVPEAEIRVRL